ncbi:MAG: MotA/TolQ/ExbB proton channel family protein [Bacillota bacterium]
MDITTLIGILAGTFLLLWAIGSGGSVLAYLDLTSAAITLGGTLAATLIHYPLPQVLSVLRVAKNAFVTRSEDPEETIRILARFADQARREGLLALEDALENLEDPFLRKGLQLVVDGTDPELVRNILETDLAALEERHRAGAGIFEAMAQYAPAFGLVGTLIGLINMLRSLEDPASVGRGMAVALLTTLYGAILANLFCLPIAGKLKARSAEEILNRQIMVEGILAIQAGDSPRIVEEKLRAFLPPSAQARAGKQRPGAVLDHELEEA